MANSVIKDTEKIYAFRNSGNTAITVNLPCTASRGYYVIGYTLSSEGSHSSECLGFISVNWDGSIKIDSSTNTVITNATFSNPILAVTIRGFASATFIKTL